VAKLQRINPSWTGEPCFVAAPGPSLTQEVVAKVRMTRWIERWRVIAVQDAYRLMPWADAMYGCNPSWWRVHKDCNGFAGEKWSTHELKNNLNDKREAAELYGVNLVAGSDGDEFSFDPGVIHYGSNSGFQAINLALLKGCRQIVLVGFDMRHVDGKSHFFGDHPKELHTNEDHHFRGYVKRFDRAAKHLPEDVCVVNATPGSALTSFRMMDLETAIAEVQRDRSVYCDRPIAHAG
jgi:hypothetical protein